MKWPLVSRAAFDLLRDELTATHAALVHERTQAREERQALVQQITDLRRKGFEPPPPPDPEIPQAEPLPAVVRAALRARLNPHSPSGREVLRWATDQLANNVDPERVAAQILHGANAELEPVA